MSSAAALDIKSIVFLSLSHSDVSYKLFESDTVATTSAYDFLNSRMHICWLPVFLLLFKFDADSGRSTHLPVQVFCALQIRSVANGTCGSYL